MAHQLAAIVVADVAENYINGNISDVKKAFDGLKNPFNAAHLALAVYQQLPAKEQASFAKLLSKWAE